MSLSNFNINDQEKTEARYTLHPEGTFKCSLIELKEGTSKMNTENKFLMAKFETSDGKINDVINYLNSTKEVEKRALSTLADLLYACDPKMSNYKDIDAMISHCENRDVYIRVYHTKPKEGFNKEAKIGGYYALDKSSRSGQVATTVTSKKNDEPEIPF